jgi:Flp pilus assembly protein TadG
MWNHSYAKRPRSTRPLRLHSMSRGISSVEFAFTFILLMAVMMGGVQLAVIGQTALALSQGASAIARYAAVNESTVGASYSGAPSAAMQQLLSSTILTNSGNDLTVTISAYQSGTTTTTTNPTPRVDRAVVTLSYNAANKYMLPNPFLQIPGIFPGISFPAIMTLTASDSQLYE